MADEDIKQESEATEEAAPAVEEEAKAEAPAEEAAPAEESQEAEPVEAAAAAEEVEEAEPEAEESKYVKDPTLKLNLKKPLDKMTAKELRQLVMDQIQQITGASGMGKDELLAAIKEVLGIHDEEGGVSPYKEQIHGLKREIRELRAQKVENKDRNQRTRLRRRINKLKKRTRRLARAS